MKWIKNLFTKNKKQNSFDYDQIRQMPNLVIDRNTRLVNFCYDNIKDSINNNEKKFNELKQTITDLGDYTELSIEELNKKNEQLNNQVTDNFNELTNKTNELKTDIENNTNNIDINNKEIEQMVTDLKKLKPFDFKGVYDNRLTYNKNDLVEHNGELYLSLFDNNTLAPPDINNWLLMEKTINIDTSKFLDKEMIGQQSIKGEVLAPTPTLSSGTQITNINYCNDKYLRKNFYGTQRITDGNHTLLYAKNIYGSEDDFILINKKYLKARISGNIIGSAFYNRNPRQTYNNQLLIFSIPSLFLNINRHRYAWGEIRGYITVYKANNNDTSSYMPFIIDVSEIRYSTANKTTPLVFYFRLYDDPIDGQYGNVVGAAFKLEFYRENGNVYFNTYYDGTRKYDIRFDVFMCGIVSDINYNP